MQLKTAADRYIERERLKYSVFHSCFLHWQCLKGSINSSLGVIASSTVDLTQRKDLAKKVTKFNILVILLNKPKISSY